jgi:hypothetical protein
MAAGTDLCLGAAGFGIGARGAGVNEKNSGEH